MESFESQEVAYRRLLELAEDGNFDRLVDNFIEKEGKNFASFIYITELNNEMEKMKQRIKDVQVSSKPFVSALSQLVLWGWRGFFSSPMCPASLLTAEPSSQPATRVGLGECKAVAQNRTPTDRRLCSQS